MIRAESPLRRSGDATALLECPLCGGDMLLTARQCRCQGCGQVVRTLAGIPDLRIVQEGPIDPEEDWALAAELAEAMPSASFPELLRRLWQGRLSPEARSSARARLRERQILDAPMRHAGELFPPGEATVTMPGRGKPGWVLDIGCGPGGGLLSAAPLAAGLIGTDISMSWLIVCKKRLEEKDIACLLICACAERLPFKRESFDLVSAFDALEHVFDRERALAEAARVLAPGGSLVATTPNRWSLGAEPHHFVWGVGFLPRRWMAGYVRWRNGGDFRFIHPLSLLGLYRLFSPHFPDGFRVTAGRVAEADLSEFARPKRAAARLYHALLRVGWLRALLTPVAPYFRIVALKPSSGQPQARP